MRQASLCCPRRLSICSPLTSTSQGPAGLHYQAGYIFIFQSSGGWKSKTQVPAFWSIDWAFLLCSHLVKGWRQGLWFLSVGIDMNDGLASVAYDLLAPIPSHHPTVSWDAHIWSWGREDASIHCILTEVFLEVGCVLRISREKVCTGVWLC